MPKFVLEPGEQKVSEHPVQLVDDRKPLPATLLLTSRRAVVLATPLPSAWWYWFGWLGALFANAAGQRESRLYYQIWRDRFGSVEAGAGKLLVFHDTGEGYAHTSFAITTRDSFADWQHRMHSWAAGSYSAAPLPPATVIDRD